MSLPDISVVMSVYNNADTLQAALDSILSQEGVDLEFIVVDDGSTDGSGAILDAAAKNDSRLKVVHKKNKGLTRSLIDGCSLVAAPWIARQDADDISFPGRLQALLALAGMNPDAILLATSCWCIGPRGERLRRAMCTSDSALARRQVLELGIGPPAHGSVMFLREAYQAVGGYRACFYYGQDSDLWMRLAEQGGLAYSNKIFYGYRFSPDSISGAHRRRQKQFGQLGQQCRDARRRGLGEESILARVQALSEDIRRGSRGSTARGLATGHYHLGCLLEHSDPAAAADYFREAIACDPLAVKPRLKLCWAKRRGRK